jgi:hypothetical protein
MWAMLTINVPWQCHQEPQTGGPRRHFVQALCGLLTVILRAWFQCVASRSCLDLATLLCNTVDEDRHISYYSKKQKKWGNTMHMTETIWANRTDCIQGCDLYKSVDVILWHYYVWEFQNVVCFVRTNTTLKQMHFISLYDIFRPSSGRNYNIVILTWWWPVHVPETCRRGKESACV